MATKKQDPEVEQGPVELDITNPEHGNLTYEELQAGKVNKNHDKTYEELQAAKNKKGQKIMNPTTDSFDNAQSFGKDRWLSSVVKHFLMQLSVTIRNNEVFSQSKLEAIGGRNLPKPQQGASTLEINDIGNVDKLGAFPN
jgi:hypothetical protein